MVTFCLSVLFLFVCISGLFIWDMWKELEFLEIQFEELRDAFLQSRITRRRKTERADD